MVYFKPQRSHYIPAGAVKVQHKGSSAVAYLYQAKSGQAAAVVFAGRRQKPDWKYRFGSPEGRAKRIGEYFAAVEAQEAARAKRKAEQAARGRGVAVGDILSAVWGYDQTNIDYFEIVGLIGKSMVEIRAIGAESEETDWMQGKSVPVPGKYIGEVMRKVAKNGSVKIDDVRSASVIEPIAKIGGKAVYGASHWTSYA